MATALSLPELRQQLDNALRHTVGILGVFCAGVGLNGPCRSLPIQDSLWFHLMHSSFSSAVTKMYQVWNTLRMGWGQCEFSCPLPTPNSGASWHITDTSQVLKSTFSTFYLLLLFPHWFLEPCTCLVFSAGSDRVLYFTLPGTSFCFKQASNKTDILDFSWY